MLVEEIDNQDESTHKNMGETDEEVQDTHPAFDDDLDHNVNDIEIEDDHVIMTMVHPVDPDHYICDLSMVSRHLAEASAKNFKPKGFYETMLMVLDTYEDVFSKTAFDTLPQHWKWDHTIELEHELSPGFWKVYLMTLTEQKEMDAFLKEALSTSCNVASGSECCH
jgi:hypothetical protein